MRLAGALEDVEGPAQVQRELLQARVVEQRPGPTHTHTRITQTHIRTYKHTYTTHIMYNTFKLIIKGTKRRKKETKEKGLKTRRKQDSRTTWACHDPPLAQGYSLLLIVFLSFFPLFSYMVAWLGQTCSESVLRRSSISCALGTTGADHGNNLACFSVLAFLGVRNICIYCMLKGMLCLWCLLAVRRGCGRNTARRS